MINQQIKTINKRFFEYCTEVIIYEGTIMRLAYTNTKNIIKQIKEYSTLNDKELKEIKYDMSYIKMTNIWAQNSHAVRKKVGALFVKDQMIISDGINGTPTSFPNKCEDENNASYPYVMHAEQNALSKLACSTQSSKDATLYVSMSPCQDCSKQIIQSKTKNVIFWEFYRKDEGIYWMLRSGINVYYYNPELYELKRS